MSKSAPSTRQDLYADVTAKIIAAIDEGRTTLSFPWHRAFGPPKNATTGVGYRGVNTVVLWAAGQAKGYSAPAWATFKQWREAGARVRAGEKGTRIIFWKTLRRGHGEQEGSASGDDDAPGGKAFVARSYAVFNQAQVDGYDRPLIQPLSETERDRRADAFFNRLPIRVVHGGDHAYYAPKADRVHLPPFATFMSAHGYYGTRAHECAHATGAKHRLDRDLSGRFGSESYAVEELVAELAAAFVCAHLGLSAEPRPDHAGYIDNWLTVLKSDDRAIFTAAAKAQQAVDWLIDAASAPPPSASPSLHQDLAHDIAA